MSIDHPTLLLLSKNKKRELAAAGTTSEPTRNRAGSDVNRATALVAAAAGHTCKHGGSKAIATTHAQDNMARHDSSRPPSGALRLPLALPASLNRRTAAPQPGPRHATQGRVGAGAMQPRIECHPIRLPSHLLALSSASPAEARPSSSPRLPLIQRR